MAGHSRAAAGLDPALSGPQLDGSLRGQWALGVRVGVGAGAQGVAPLEEAEVGAVGDGSRVRGRSRLTHPQLGQGEVPPCGRDSEGGQNLMGGGGGGGRSLQPGLSAIWATLKYLTSG